MANRIPGRADYVIPKSTIDEHEYMADALLDGTIAKDCNLVYPPKKTECPNCWTGNSFVQTIDGYKKIKDVNIGDQVYNGEYYDGVINKFESDYSGELYRLKAFGVSIPDWITPNHKLPVIRGIKDRITSSKFKHMGRQLKFEEIPVSEIVVGDYVVSPFQHTNFNKDFEGFHDELLGDVDIDDDFLILLGWWLAEGYIHKSKEGIREGSFALCASKEQNRVDLIQRILKRKFDLKSSIQDFRKYNQDTIAVNFYSTKLARFFIQCGIGSKNKHIPDFLWNNLSLKQKSVVLANYHFGDGGIHKTDRYVTTISKTLALQSFEILHQMKLFPSFTYEDARVDKNGINHKECYKVLWNQNRSKRKGGTHVYEFGTLHKIRDIQQKYSKELVYNLSVKNIHRYTVNNIVTMNCYLDPSTGRSSNIYKPGGPIPFPNYTIDPWCGSRGILTLPVEETIKLRAYWEPRDWISIGVPNFQLAGSMCQVIGYMTDLPKLERAETIVLNINVKGIRRWVCERSGEAVPWGFRQNRYFVQFVKRIGGA